MNESIVSQLRTRYPNGLFTHQAVAVEHALAGRNVVVTTRTSSGKSLIYAIPVAQALIESNEATAIFCYPQKALANDQLAKFRELIPEILCAAGLSVQPTVVSRYDGGTPNEERPAIRKSVRVLLTNPDMLHASVLAWHDKHWQRFLSGLRYIVLDEAHDYRGTFGSNVALILRRLLLLCERYGSRPQFIATSATMSAPAAHLMCLTGRSFTTLDPELDGSAQGAKVFWLVQSSAHAFQLARILMRHFLDANLSVIAFCLSRRSAEQLASDSHEQDPRIAVYKAGLLQERREEIEEGLREGTVRGVFATSALELGIDIGALDVCICIGLPNTMMSLWQRAGRVGRGGKAGAVILIPEERPLDAYYVNKPDELFARENETLAVNLKSRTLAVWHYACALKEANRELDVVAPDSLPDPLKRIAEEHRGGLDDQSFHADDVHFHYNVRAGCDSRYELVCDGDEKIGEINRSQILREAAPHAIHLHDRTRYRVLSVRERAKQVRLHREYSFNRTNAFVRIMVRLQQTWRAGENDSFLLQGGRLLVTESLLSLKEVTPDGLDVRVYQGNQGLSANILPTTGVCFTVRTPSLLLRNDSLMTPHQPRQAWNGLEPLFRGLLPAVLGPCDLRDFNIHSEWGEVEAKLFFYDQAYEGIDLTLPTLDRMDDLIDVGIVRLDECDCSEPEGCFRCVRDAFTDRPTCKASTLELLRSIRAALATNPLEIHDIEPSPDRLAAIASKQPCGVCGKRQPLEAKFCSNCGSRMEES